ncbi:MAG: hypothetical protein ABSH16_10100 [Sedimentisphaerales bacterium]
MRKVYICMFVLALVGLLAIITGCEEQAAKQPSATPQQPTKVVAEKAKPAAAPAPAPKPAPAKPAEAAKPAAEKGSATGPYGFKANFEDAPGFIVNWLVIGPFPNPGDRPDNKGFNTDYLGGEAAYTPANGMEVKDPNGTILKWQPYQSNDALVNFFEIPFLKLEQGQEDILCYCACWLEADADKDVEIRVGSDDGYKLWLNHKEVGVVHEYRSSGVDQETYKVKLDKGLNLVLIKVDQDYGEYEFMLRVVTADGKPVEGVKIWNQK